MGDFLLFQNRKSSMILYIRKKYKNAMRMKKGAGRFKPTP